MKRLIRVGIVDDHPGVRVAIRELLSKDEDILVVGEGKNGLEAMQIADSQKPDVLLLDAEMPVLKGTEVVQRIHEREPEIKVLALSSYTDPMYILGMLENGASGYLTKDEAPSMLLVAVRSIMKEEVKWISPKIADHVSNITLENMTFTGRELEILRYIVLDKSDDEIVELMGIDDGLLRRFIALLIEKFEVDSRVELVKAAQPVISTTTSE